jgi:hypothetical protein
MHVEHLFYIYLIHIEVYPDDKGVEICKFIQYLKPLNLYTSRHHHIFYDIGLIFFQIKKYVCLRSLVKKI